MKLPGIAVAALAITALVGGTAAAQVTMQPIPNPSGPSTEMAVHHHHWHHHHHHHHMRMHGRHHHHHMKMHGRHHHHHMMKKGAEAAPAPAAEPAPAATPQ